MAEDGRIELLAAALGTSVPDEATQTVILELASIVAHSLERRLAPIACWMIGQSSHSPEIALALLTSALEVQ